METEQPADPVPPSDPVRRPAPRALWIAFFALLGVDLALLAILVFR